MRKLIVPLMVSVAVFGGVLSCKGGNSPSEPSNDTGGSYSATPSAAGQPSDLDLARLTTRFGTIGAGVLQQTLSASANSASLSGIRAVRAPTGVTTVSAAFLCCSTTAGTNVQVTGSVGSGAAGSVPVDLEYSTNGPLQWTGNSAGTAWDLSFEASKLKLTGTLSVTSGTIGPNQQLALSGTLQYISQGNSIAGSVSLPIAVTYTVPDVGALATNASGDSIPLTAAGHIGSLEISSGPLPTVNMTGRCSRPQEGCGPGVMGQCPCTQWPPCPIYGITCSGSFR